METPIGNYLNKKIGYNGLPVVVSENVFKTLSTNRQILYRGVTDYKGTSAKDMADQFKFGNFYAGRGVYGNGTYVDANKAIAEYYAYSSKGNASGVVMEMIFSDGTKIVSFLDIFTEYEKTGITRIPAGKREAYQEVINNVGAYAAIKGYDAISLDGFNGKNYIIVLNRSKVIVKGDGS